MNDIEFDNWIDDVALALIFRFQRNAQYTASYFLSPHPTILLRPEKMSA